MKTWWGAPSHRACCPTPFGPGHPGAAQWDRVRNSAVQPQDPDQDRALLVERQGQEPRWPRDIPLQNQEVLPASDKIIVIVVLYKEVIIIREIVTPNK